MADVLLPLLLLAAAAGPASSLSESPVYVLNQHSQLVTSSTLKWVKATGGARPSNSVAGGRNETAEFPVCRAAQRGGGHFHAGHLVAPACRAVVGDGVVAFPKYQVLVNVDGSARLEWANWHQFTALGKGAVSADEDVMVARAWVPEAAGSGPRTLTPGGLYLQRQYGLILIAAGGGDAGRQRHTTGQVLVEREPVSYRLEDFVRERQTGESQRDVDVPDQNIVISSGDAGGQGETFNVSFSRRLWFGRGHSIPVGSEVSVDLRGDNGFVGGEPPVGAGGRRKLDLLWGVQKEEKVFRQVRLNYPLPSRTRVRVSLAAREIKRKFEYSATLMTTFEDGAMLTRPIRGRFQEVTLDRFAPIYSDPVPVRLGSTTAATTTATTATKTTPTTTPAATRPPKLKRARTAGAAAPASANKKATMIKSYRYPLDEGRSSGSPGRAEGASSSSLSSLSSGPSRGSLPPAALPAALLLLSLATD